MATLAEQQVAHIWRRLGFGPTGADLDHGLSVGPTALINDLLARKATTPAQWAFPTDETWQGQVSYLGRQLHLMGTSTNPLQERLAWILQGLVVVGLTDSVQFPQLKVHIARLRVNPLGSYTQLLRDTAVLPAMMQYLNGDQNGATHPNQNYARELMELFALGRVNPVTGVQNYSQQDVIEVARALTGYTFDWSTGTIGFDPSEFDHGAKTFFGVHHGNAHLSDVITAVSQHPSYRFFVPARLYRELTGLQPSVATLKSLGALWGTAGNVRAVVSAIVHSPDFVSPAAIGSKIKTPIELMVSGAKVMGYDLSTSDFGWQLDSFMNQHPMFPPNVSGWPVGKIWLNAGVTMAWNGIVQEYATTSLAQPHGTVAQLVARATKANAAATAIRLCGLSDVRATTMKSLTSYVNAGPWNRVRAAGLLALVLVSPEFATN